MDRMIDINSPEDIPSAYRDTPIGRLLEYHNLNKPTGAYEKAELLIGTCMDHRIRLDLPDNFAYIIRAAGANLGREAFQVSFAIAVGGVRCLALIGHTDCGMSELGHKEEKFIRGLAENAGWEADKAAEHFNTALPAYDIGKEIDFVLAEARRLYDQYPQITIAPMLYKVDNKKLCLLKV